VALESHDTPRESVHFDRSGAALSVYPRVSSFVVPTSREPQVSIHALDRQIAESQEVQDHSGSVNLAFQLPSVGQFPSANDDLYGILDLEKHDSSGQVALV
jgi:hypothetical protein